MHKSQIAGVATLSLLLLSLFSSLHSEGNHPIESAVDEVPEGYVHRPIVEFFTGLGCSFCQSGADQAMDRHIKEHIYSPEQQFTFVVFHQNNGAGDDDLTTEESQERYDYYYVTGTPNAQFDGGYRQVAGGTNNEDEDYQNYEEAMNDCLTRYEDNNINPLDDNFKFVNLYVTQEFDGDRYRVRVKVEYLGTGGSVPTFGIIRSETLRGTLYVFMTENNVTAWSSERNGGEYVVNQAVFRGYAIKDEQFELGVDEVYETAGEWVIPQDAVIPIKPGDITAVAAVYDRDDTSSGKGDGGNPANVPRAIQSATPASTAYDLGYDIPRFTNVSVEFDGDVKITARIDDDSGIAKAYLLYNTNNATSLYWESVEMDVTGDEVCEGDVCDAYANAEATATITVEEGKTLYYMILAYDGDGIQGRSEVYTYTFKSSAGNTHASLNLPPVELIGLGVIGLFALGAVHLLVQRYKGKVPVNAQRPKRSRKLVFAVIFIIAIVVIGGIAYALSSMGVEKAPDFTLKEVETGKEFSLSDFRGKVVVLDFMGIECPTCEKVAKNLKTIYSKYDESEVVIITIDVRKDDTPSELVDYKHEHGAKWRHARDTDNLIEKYGIYEVPKIVIVDGDGYITFENVGYTSTDDLKREIDKASSGEASIISPTSISIWGLALIAGVASFFSPCSFPLLPGYMTYYLGIDREKSSGLTLNTVKKSLPAGIASASGILTVYMVVGIIVIGFGEAVNIDKYIPMLQPAVGIIILVLGLLLITNIQYHFLVSPFKCGIGKVMGKVRKEGKSKGLFGLFSYGIGYGAAAAGCTAPLIIALIISALGYGLIGGIVIFLIFSLSAAVLMVLVTILVAASEDTIINKLKVKTELIKKISGVVFIIVGVYLILYYFTSF